MNPNPYHIKIDPGTLDVVVTKGKDVHRVPLLEENQRGQWALNVRWWKRYERHATRADGLSEVQDKKDVEAILESLKVAMKTSWSKARDIKDAPKLTLPKDPKAKFAFLHLWMAASCIAKPAAH